LPSFGLCMKTEKKLSASGGATTTRGSAPGPRAGHVPPMANPRSAGVI